MKKGPDDMEKFRDILWQFNIEHKSEQYRDQRKVITHEIFEVKCDFRVQAKFEGDHETGKLKIMAKNVGDFNIDVFQMMALEFNDKAVEEFAKYFIGRPNEWAEIVKRSTLNQKTAAAPVPQAEGRAAVRRAQGSAQGRARGRGEARPPRLAALLHQEGLAPAPGGPARMPRLAILVGTRKGLFLLKSGRDRRGWSMDGPHFLGRGRQPRGAGPARRAHAARRRARRPPGPDGVPVRRTPGERGAKSRTPPAFATAAPGEAGESVTHVFWLTPGHRYRAGALVRRHLPAGALRLG